MESIFALLRPTGAVGLIFTLTYGAFRGLEAASSPGARADFAAYLTSPALGDRVTHLPDNARLLFEKVFGARHFSFRCVWRCFLFSLFADLAVFLLSALSHWDAVKAAHEDLIMAPAFVWVFVLWLSLALVVDYLNLLKTRLLLNRVVWRLRSLWTLVGLVATDLLIGLFVLGVVAILSIRILGTIQELLGQYSGLDASWSEVFDLIKDVGRFNFPTANIYVASLVPSIWLWLYLLAALAIRTLPPIRFFVYFLDTKDKPISSVGLVVATILSLSYAGGLVVNHVLHSFAA